MLRRTTRSLSLLLAALLLASCSTRETLAPGLSGPQSYVRPVQDGKPWWKVDVSRIPDARPVPHEGSYKNQPYVVRNQRYYPLASAAGYREVGEASWYGTLFHGRKTAIGEWYDLYGMTAAHKTLPLPAYVKVTNLANGRQVLLRVNDRGPFHSDRIIDLSYGAAVKLGFADQGVARVMVESVDPDRWWRERGLNPPPPTRVPMKLPPVARRTTDAAETFGPQFDQPVGQLESSARCLSRWASSPAGLLRSQAARTAATGGGVDNPPPAG